MSCAHILSAAAVVLALTVPGPALAAQEDAAPPIVEPIFVPPIVIGTLEDNDSLNFNPPQSCFDLLMSEPLPGGDEACVSDESLADLRGGETIVVGNQTLIAITAGNVLNGDYFAGNVHLSDNALSNFTGVGNLIINTGAQVSLQAGMNLVINTGP